MGTVTTLRGALARWLAAVAIALSSPCSATDAPARPVAARSATLSLSDLEDAFKNVARRVAPAVVSISATSTALDVANVRTLTAPQLQAALAPIRHGVGAGFVIDADGYILTSEHVIAGREQIWITTDDARVHPAIVIAADRRNDLAMLRIPARNLPIVTFASPDPTAERGQWTITLGNPWGTAEAGSLSMSVGVVSATGRALPELILKEDRFYSNLIQTTAEVNPGNSGGPLFNLNGEVLGIVTAVRLAGVVNPHAVSFAIPANREFHDAVGRLKRGDDRAPRHRRWRGLLLADVPSHWHVNHAALPAGGILVLSADPDATAVAKPGQIITAAAGRSLKNLNELAQLDAQLRGGRIDLQLLDLTPTLAAIAVEPAKQ